MRIRARYRGFRILIALAVLVFLVTLFDMFRNAAEWRPWLLIAYMVIAVVALLLYIGHKPKLGGEPVPVAQPAPEPVPLLEPEPVPVALAAAPAVEEEVLDVEEVPKPRVTVPGLEGPHQFKCPFCQNVFGLEASHMARTADFRIDCPYCAKRIRVPRHPKVTRDLLADLARARPENRIVFNCQSCGEFIRVTAPSSEPTRVFGIETCPQCRARTVAPVPAVA